MPNVKIIKKDREKRKEREQERIFFKDMMAYKDQMIEQKDEKIHTIIYVNFVTYDFNRQDFDQLIQTYFEDETTCPFIHIIYQYERNYNVSQERDCHIQGFLCLKKKTKFEVEHDVERFSKYEFIRNTISTSNKKRVTNCQCSYEDLNDFSECKWCTLECCSQ
ncbi:12655_t:CDS:2, partial [Dentiscutata erythropus]